jgi:hypothetical protein
MFEGVNDVGVDTQQSQLKDLKDSAGSCADDDRIRLNRAGRFARYALNHELPPEDQEAILGEEFDQPQRTKKARRPLLLRNRSLGLLLRVLCGYICRC